MSIRPLLALLTLAPLLGGCADSSEAAAHAESPAVLRFSGIPDADKQKLAQQYAAVTAYLSDKLGLPVEYVHAPDYTGAVTGLAANKLDLVWLGGVTAVEAEEVTGGKAVFLAARDTDLQFKSYLIANRALVDSGRFRAIDDHAPGTLAQLAALEPALAECTFTFGSKSSTSGHIMPRHFLEDPSVGIVAEKDFKAPAGYQLKGGHSATLQAVASGAVDAGVLNYASWDSASDEQKAAAPVVWVSPEYVDYCMVAHERLGPELTARIRAALVELDPSVPAQAAVLEAFSAERFVAVKPEQWDGIRSVLASAKARGVLD